MAAAYPCWVMVRGASTCFVLGTAWVLDHRDTAPYCRLLGRSGLILMNSTALCCPPAMLSSCGALPLGSLGLKQGRMAILLLHSQ